VTLLKGKQKIIFCLSVLLCAFNISNIRPKALSNIWHLTPAFPEGMPMAKAGVIGDHLGWASALSHLELFS